MKTMFAIVKRLAATFILLCGMLCAAVPPLLAQQPQPALQIQSGHKSGAFGLVFTADGRYLFSAGTSEVLQWDIATGKIIRRIPVTHPVRLAVSLDGRWLLVTRLKAPAMLWDLQTGMRAGSTGDNAYFAQFTPDGAALEIAEVSPGAPAMASTGTLTRYDLATREVAEPAVKLPGMVLGVSTDGREAITFTGTPTEGVLYALEVEGAACRRWELATDREIARFAELPENCHLGPTAVTADASRVAAVIADGKRAPRRLMIWNGQTGQLLHAIPLPGLAVFSLEFNAAGTRVAAATISKKVVVWDVEAGTQLQALDTALPDTQAVAFSPDGARLATALVTSVYQPDAHEIDVRDAETGEVAQVLSTLLHPVSVLEAVLTPDGRWLAAATAENIFLWDLAQGRLARVIPLPATARPGSIALSPDGGILAVAAGLGPLGGSYREMTHRLLAWDTVTGKQLPALTRELPNFTRIAFSPTGEFLATGVSEQRVQLWHPATGREILATPRIEGFVTGMTVSADGKRLAWIINAKATPDATDLTVGSLHILEIATGTITSYRADANMTLAYPFFSPDGGQVLVYAADQRFLLADAVPKQQVLLISATTGTVTRQFELPSGRVIPLGFVSKGTEALGSALDQGALIPWDTATGKTTDTLLPKFEQACAQLLIDRAATRWLFVFPEDGSIRIQRKLWMWAEEPRPPVDIRFFDNHRWLITTPQGDFDCSPGLEPFLTWQVGGETFPYKKYAEEYHHPEKVRQLLAGE